MKHLVLTIIFWSINYCFYAQAIPNNLDYWNRYKQVTKISKIKNINKSNNEFECRVILQSSDYVDSRFDKLIVIKKNNYKWNCKYYFADTINWSKTHKFLSRKIKIKNNFDTLFNLVSVFDFESLSVLDSIYYNMIPDTSLSGFPIPHLKIDDGCIYYCEIKIDSSIYCFSFSNPESEYYSIKEYVSERKNEEVLKVLKYYVDLFSLIRTKLNVKI